VADTVARLQERLRAAQPVRDTEALLEQLVARIRKDTAPDCGRRDRLPERGRKVHARRLARRGRQGKRRCYPALIGTKPAQGAREIQ
jgi:hypothetical protein